MVAFLVEHPGAGRVLVDTGFHPSIVVAPHEAFGRVAGRVIKDVKVEPEQLVSSQLRELGIQPADVDVVVMTHLHSDHASGIAEYPESTFVVSAAEWEAAGSGGRMQGYWGRQFDHAFEWRTVDFESPDADSYATFGRSLDLFGDGSVRLVSTPGHTAGHLSVVLRLREREALLTGDAAYTRRTHRGDGAALPDGGRAPLQALAARDPAVRARAARRARDLRARLRAVAHAARASTSSVLPGDRPARAAAPAARRAARAALTTRLRPSVRSRECSARTSSKITSDAAWA